MTERGSFVLITGIGCHASWWLGRILNRPNDGIIWFHEKKNRLMGGKWQRLMAQEEERGVDVEFYQPYWNWAEQMRQQFHVVGDSNSWATIRIPEVHAIMGVDRVIYLIRNGISQLHCWWYVAPSVYQHEDFVRPLWYNKYLRRQWEMLGQPFGEWSEMTKWEKWCFFWWANTELVGWLTERVPGVGVYHTEDLTKKTDALGEFLQGFGLRTEISTLKDWIAWKGRPKKRGKLSLEYIWGFWSPDMREAFHRICGDRMTELGYEIPVTGR